jgi:D-serine deaminase-like pyridoxal phosphate-dependent protein
MVIDLDQVRRNISKVQTIATKAGKDLRPHSKTHKIPYLSKLQIQAGANGVCVQKVAEAEVMFNGGIKDIFLSNEIIGTKFNRVASLIQKGCNIVVAVDNMRSVEEFSSACSYFSVDGHVMIDVNVGMNRCGIDPADFHPLLNAVVKSRHIVVDGIMAYDGQINYPDPAKRKSEVIKEEKMIVPLIKEMNSQGFSHPKVSVGGTPTWEIWSNVDLANELQPGTYIYYDTHCMHMGLCSIDHIAIGVVSTVTSEKVEERFVLDAGYKSVSMDQGVYPTVVDGDGNQYEVIAMSEEHTVVRATDHSTKLGRKFILLPYHSCTTTDLWDGTYAISEKDRPEYLIIQGRGKRE